MAVLGFVSDANFQEHLKGALHQVSADKTAAYWQALAPKANRNAYRTILNILLARGYTKAQILAWPGGEDFQLDLGVFWAIVKGGACNPNDFDAELLKLLDRREELKEVVVTDPDDVVIDQGGSSFGTGGYDISGDIFTWPTDEHGDDAVDLGEQLRF